MESELLKKLINRAPTGSGIYIFTSLNRNKLYIGKASNIKARLLSYLKTTDPRILQMLSRATNIKTVETGSEVEALIMESQYIKRHKPAFNIMLRDDKNFFYVAFTNQGEGSRRGTSVGIASEKWPKIFITHQPAKILSIRYQVLRGRKSHNTEYIIPNTDFVGPFTDGTALKTTLRHIRRVFPYCTCKKQHNNFCLNYHIGKCPGFCCLKNPKDLGFKIYDLRKYLKNIRANKEILSGKKNYLLKNLEKEMIELGKKERFQEAIDLRGKVEKIKRVFENAKIIKERLGQRYDTSKNHCESALLELKEFLKIKQLPRRIEGYDAANIQGEHAVGAMVVFADGQPDKNGYRKFKVRGTGDKEFSGDAGMLKEIITRRFRHHEWPLPDLVLIDGGKGQLNAAHSAICNCYATFFKTQMAPLLIALTKNDKHFGEKIYIDGTKNPILLSRLPVSVKNLFLQIDAEAHRFAIGYYRKLHRNMVKLTK